MVPGVISVIEEIPVTSSGKVDRRALTEIEWKGDKAAGVCRADYLPGEDARRDMAGSFVS